MGIRFFHPIKGKVTKTGAPYALYPLGRHLREKRAILSISQEQMANGVCDLLAYQALESNQAYPNDIELAYLCKRLGLNFLRMDNAIRMSKLLARTLNELERRNWELADQLREKILTENELFSLTEYIIRQVNALAKN